MAAQILPFFAATGSEIFDNLALLFAVGVAAVGLSDDQNGVSGLAGVIDGLSYNKFRTVKLPDYLAFFGRRRLVLIMTGLISFVVAVRLAMIWPNIQSALSSASVGIAGMGAMGVALFQFFNRLLIPMGLHHVLNSFLWFQLGDYNGVAGDLRNWGIILCGILHYNSKIRFTKSR